MERTFLCFRTEFFLTELQADFPDGKRTRLLDIYGLALSITDWWLQMTHLHSRRSPRSILTT